MKVTLIRCKWGILIFLREAPLGFSCVTTV